MTSLLAVFIGGGFGSVLRYGISRWIPGDPQDFPLATLVANLLSCIILGFLLSYNFKTQMPENIKLLFMVGFCGGFSTFSTFSNETFYLFESGNTFYAFLNIAGSVILCLFSIYLGLLIGKSISV